jgi:hypothetical protein
MKALSLFAPLKSSEKVAVRRIRSSLLICADKDIRQSKVLPIHDQIYNQANKDDDMIICLEEQTFTSSRNATNSKEVKSENNYEKRKSVPEANSAFFYNGSNKNINDLNNSFSFDMRSSNDSLNASSYSGITDKLEYEGFHSKRKLSKSSTNTICSVKHENIIILKELSSVSVKSDFVLEENKVFFKKQEASRAFDTLQNICSNLKILDPRSIKSDKSVLINTCSNSSFKNKKINTLEKNENKMKNNMITDDLILELKHNLKLEKNAENNKQNCSRTEKKVKSIDLNDQISIKLTPCFSFSKNNEKHIENDFHINLFNC